MTASFRVDPGLAVQIQQAIEIEKDPFTLFSIALDQTTAVDLRRLAVNKLDDLRQADVLEFIRTSADHEMCEAICRSNLFPLSYKSFARAALGRPELKPKPKLPDGEGRWIKALFTGNCVRGHPVEANTRCYYYKASKQILCESCGQRAAQQRRAA